MALDSIYRKRKLEESKYGYEGIKKETRLAYNDDDLDFTAMADYINSILNSIDTYTMDDIKSLLESKYNQILAKGTSIGVDFHALADNLVACYRKMMFESRKNPLVADRFYEKAEQMCNLCDKSSDEYIAFAQSIAQQKTTYNALLPDIISEINEIGFGPDAERLTNLFQSYYTAFLGSNLKVYNIDNIQSVMGLSESISTLNSNFVRADEIYEKVASIDGINTETISTVKHNLAEGVITGNDALFVQIEGIIAEINKAQEVEKNQPELSDISMTF